MAPGLTSDPPTKLKPTGSNLPGGSSAVAYPAQKLWRWPEAAAVARDDGEARDLRVANEAVDFSALCVSGAVVTSTQSCVGVLGPRLLGETRGQVLRVGAPVQRGQRVAPDFPRRRRSLEPVLEPCLLLRPENRLGRRAPLRIGDMRIVEPDFRRGITT